MLKLSTLPSRNQIINTIMCLFRGYKFGLMTLEFKKFSDPNEDVYYKDFLDLLDTDPKVGNDLGIIKVAFVRDSSKCSIAKIQSSGYKAHHFLGIASQESKNDNEYCKKWADKIINFMNNEIEWKYSNNYKLRGDLTKMINGKVANCLDEVLLNEDIGSFVGMFLFESVDDIKDNSDVMKDIFGNVENLEIGDSILMANWKIWNNDED
jgi:hypothetical protein